MKNARIRIGVLGAANIARRSMMPAMQQSSDKFELVGLASRNDDKGREAAAAFGIKSWGSYEQLLASGEVAAIYIPLPNALHRPWVMAALEKGIHVLCEKSLGCTQLEVAEMTEMARKKNVVLMETFQFRFHDQFRFIVEKLNGGSIGALRSLRACFGFPPFPEATNIRYSRELGGGALLDAGAYAIKIAQLLLGEELEVKAASLSGDASHEVDLWGGGFLQARNSDAFAEIDFGFDQSYQCSLELWGSKGRIYTDRIFTAPPNHAPTIWMETPGKETVSLKPDNHFIKLLNHFHELITTREGVEIEHLQNISQARLIEEFRKKANEK